MDWKTLAQKLSFTTILRDFYERNGGQSTSVIIETFLISFSKFHQLVKGLTSISNDCSSLLIAGLVFQILGSGNEFFQLGAPLFQIL